MRTFDLSPLFRTSVGYDRMARLLDSMASEPTASYPPYNIEKLSDEAYIITMAVAGFREEDLDIQVQENQLTIAGRLQTDENQPDERVFLYRGIAERAFERRFSLADHIKVSGARLNDGLLHVDLVREVPEAAKPRRVEITNAVSEPVQQKIEPQNKASTRKVKAAA